MTPEEVGLVWKSQQGRSHSAAGLEEIVVRGMARIRRQLIVSLVFGVACIVLSTFNFYHWYVVDHKTLIASVLRAVPLLALAPIQFSIYRKLARVHQERQSLVVKHRAWLSRWVAELESEVRGEGRWKLAAFVVLSVASIAVSKLLDYRQGEDSLAACLGIPLSIIVICLLAAIAAWHYRTQFLIPELQRCRRMLNELDEP